MTVVPTCCGRSLHDRPLPSRRRDHAPQRPAVLDHTAGQAQASGLGQGCITVRHEGLQSGVDVAIHTGPKGPRLFKIPQPRPDSPVHNLPGQNTRVIPFGPSRRPDEGGGEVDFGGRPVAGPFKGMAVRFAGCGPSWRARRRADGYGQSCSRFGARSGGSDSILTHWTSVNDTHRPMIRGSRENDPGLHGSPHR